MAVCPRREKYRCDGDCFICQPHWKTSSCPWCSVWKAPRHWVFLELFGGSNQAGAQPRVHASGWRLHNVHVQSPTMSFTTAKICLPLYFWGDCLFQKYRPVGESGSSLESTIKKPISPKDSPTSSRKMKDKTLLFSNSFLTLVGLRSCVSLWLLEVTLWGLFHRGERQLLTSKRLQCFCDITKGLLPELHVCCVMLSKK